MPASCLQEEEIAYVKKPRAHESRSWRNHRAFVLIHVRDGSGDWEVDKVDKSVATTRVKADIKSLFVALEDQWKSDTWHVSSIRKTISHAAYLKIIGMGKDALPYIFESMRKEKSLWFWALEAITREDNILPASTSMDELHDAWLGWAADHGY